jgi:hypothetical protein
LSQYVSIKASEGCRAGTKEQLGQTFHSCFQRDRFSEILNEKEYWGFVSQMAEIIQPEGVDMFQMDLVHIHAVLRNRSYDMEPLMRRVSAWICRGWRRTQPGATQRPLLGTVSSLNLRNYSFTPRIRKYSS